MQNVIQLPPDLFDALHKEALAQRKTTDTLVVEWVSARLDMSEMRGVDDAFEQEVAIFEQLKPTLLKQYKDQYVAIHNGEIVANGYDKLALLHQVRKQFGDIICYIEKVAVESPRIVRVPSHRLAHDSL